MPNSLTLRLGLLLSLYLCQGLPTGIFTQALPAILRQYGVPLSIIGLSGFLAVPWALKFLLAPWVDSRFSPRIGQRRSWILPLQVSAFLALLLVAFFDPHSLASPQGVAYFFALMFLVNLLASTQDIATDGLAVRLLAFHERGLGNGVQVAGYRLGLIVGGGLLLYLVGVLGWQNSFFLLAALLALLTLPILFFREPAPIKNSHEPVLWWQIFLQFFQRPGLRGWLIVLITYKAGESLGTAMVKPMLVDMGLNLKQIGLMVSLVGSLATLLGALLGGWLTAKIGRSVAIVGFGAFQALAVAAYMLIPLNHVPGQLPALEWVYAINALEHFASGMAMAALLTAVMDLCRAEHAATDFTLQVSILAGCGGVFHLGAGFVAEALGYTGYFLLSAVLALLLLWPAAIYSRRLPWLQGLHLAAHSGDNARS